MVFDVATHQCIERDVAAYVASIRLPALCRDEFDIGYRITEHRNLCNALRQSKALSGIQSDLYPHTRCLVIYWRKRYWTWRGYAPLPEAFGLARVLQEFDAGPAGCFWDEANRVQTRWQAGVGGGLGT